MITEPETLVVFSLAALAILAVPGPAVVYIVTRSIDQGRGAGVASVLGIHVGTLVHLTAATVGLSAILVSSATAFTIVKVLGALYLIVIGIRTLVRELPVATSTTALPVTVSVGGTLLDGSVSPSAAFHRADGALYDAKRTRDASAIALPPRLTLQIETA